MPRSMVARWPIDRVTTRRVLLGVAVGGMLADGVLAQSPRPDTAANEALAGGPPDIAAFVEMAGDIRLEPHERAAIEGAEERLAAGQPRAAWHEAAVVLARFRGLNLIGQASIRHPARAAVHFAVHDDRTAIDILSRRDPVLVEDVARKEVVTMADVRAIAATNDFVAEIAGLNAPPMTEEPGDRERLRAAYESQAGMRVATTQASLRHATVMEVWRRLEASKQAEIAAIIRSQVRDSAAVPDAARELENIMVAAVQRARDQAALAEFNRYMARVGQASVAIARFDGLSRNLELMNRLFRP